MSASTSVAPSTQSAPPWCIVVLAAICLTISPLADSKALRVYLDADRQEHFASARAIELGVRTALSEVEHHVAGYDIEVVPLDHRGNVKRSKLNMRKFLEDPDSLAMFGGLHSPPYLKYRAFINENRILLLLPWSAAGPLTRAEDSENWVFRLSIDDRKAAARIVQFAFDSGKCTTPALVLWESGWGRTNEKTLTEAISTKGVATAPVFYFPGSLESTDARVLALRLEETGSDCAFLIANVREGIEIVSAMAELENPPTVFSHWGITGGRFERDVDARARRQVDLHVLQTCYPQDDQELTPKGRATMALARQLFPEEIGGRTQLSAPAGFFHGYDLAQLLIAALSNNPNIKDVATLRRSVKQSLESLSVPVQGLMRVYDQPFRPYDLVDPDAHEALDFDDLCMARYGTDGTIEIIPNSKPIARN